MKTYILLFLLVFAFSYNIQAQKSEIKKSDSACSETKGQVISLDKFKGSVLVLYFFGDNMDKWHKSITELNRLKEEFENKKVKIGALTPKTQNEIKTFTQSIDFLMFAKSIDFAVVTENDSVKKYNIKPPYAYVIDQNGKIYWKGESLKNISKKINDLLAKSANINPEGTNVYDAKLTGEAVRHKNTTPKLNYDDSQGIPHYGLTTSGKTMPKKEKKKSGDRIPGQTIRQYEVTPGIINEREPPRRTIKPKND